MEQGGPPVQQYTVQLLTPSFQFGGQLEVIGSLLDYLNDSVRDALILHQAHVAPLQPGSAMREVNRPQISVRKREVVFLHFTDPEAQSEARLLARKEPYIIYTTLAVLRGDVHLPAETRIHDLMATMSGDFLSVTNSSLFMLAQLPTPLPEKGGFLLVGQRHIQFYHTT